MVRVGQRIVIPDVRRPPRAEAKRSKKASAPHKPAKHPDTHRATATTDSPHSAFKASTVPPAAHPAPVKVAEPAGALPSFRWPVRGRVITSFGPKPNGLQNDGIDLAVPKGTPIKAADDGVVAYAGNELKGYGNLVLIRHSNGYVTAYAHASEILVRRGETVKRGQVIAKSGETGSVKSPELHFEIRKGATPVDPAQFLNGA
jgi:murein DD-endopeptidase MepM/ murein hydrolase activator NlpD